MANTSAYRDVEKWVRDDALREKFGQPFQKRKITIGTKSNGEPAKHEFDAVSKDEKIIVSIKASSGLTIGGLEPRGKYAESFVELYYLSILKGKEKRILLLTDKEYFNLFQKESDGKLPEGVVLMFFDPPEQLKKQVELARQKASEEVSPNKR